MGLVTRRQRRWEAQQIVLLVACLAHHLLLWSKRWLSRIPTTRRRLQGYGLVQLLRDAWAMPGIIRWQRGWMVSVRFSILHPLRNPASGELCHALLRTRTGEVFALKTGSCPRFVARMPRALVLLGWDLHIRKGRWIGMACIAAPLLVGCHNRRPPTTYTVFAVWAARERYRWAGSLAANPT